MLDTFNLKKRESKSERPAPGGGGPASAEKPPKAEPPPPPPPRLTSLDAYRGLIMTMLAANAFGILAFTQIDASSPLWNSHDREFWQQVGFHFDHPQWESKFGLMGVSFWDLIQPAFMFMVGVAMPFSYRRRRSLGQQSWTRHLHAVIRALVLVLLGVFLSSMGDPQTDWIFPNVLCQIGLGYLFVYALLGCKWYWQTTAITAILAGYWALFYFNPPPAEYDYAAVLVPSEEPVVITERGGEGNIYEGKFAPWSKNGNAAHFADLKLLNWFPRADEAYDTGVAEDGTFLFNPGGYQTLNFVPSIATMLLGVLCGQLLLVTALGTWKKLGTLILMGGICLGLALAAELICPVVKRIWTPSWVFFSGAYVIWGLAAFYLLFDALPLKIIAFPLVVVGMNSILMYMMGQLIGGWTIDQVHIHLGVPITNVFGEAALDPQMYGPIFENSAKFLVFWLIAYWLYRQRYFIRI